MVSGKKPFFFRPGEYQDEKSVRDYISDGSEVACEAFFNGAFFGTRKIASADELILFLTKFGAILNSSKNGADFLKKIQQECGIPIGVNFKFAEIGAVNAWKSVGAFEIKSPSDALESFDALWEGLQNTPVGLNTSHKKAIEFAFDNGDMTTHWIACPISDEQEPFRLNKEKLKEALTSFCNKREE